MLVLSDPRLRAPFTAEKSFEFEFPASCFASESTLKKFQEIVIEYADGQQTLAAIRIDKKHFVPDGETAHAFTSSQQCRDSASPTGATIWKAAFRPV